MAGDWIKMRGNLWDDPRVAKLCDLTDSGEAAVVGALYWLWATADQHSEDGVMPGLTLRQIDRKTGLPGFAAALVAIGWLTDDPAGVCIVKFEEHNGASAKKRCQTAKRVAEFKSGNAKVTLPALPDEHESVIAALPREEKRREEKKEKENPPPPVGGEPPVAKARKVAVFVNRPDGVTEQTWGDWLALRAKKRAPVTVTVLEGAVEEAAKASMALEDFLKVWCQRGSQGLQADWLRPAERGPAAPAQTFRERDQELAAARVHEMTGGLVSAKPAKPFFIEDQHAPLQLG